MKLTAEEKKIYAAVKKCRGPENFIIDPDNCSPLQRYYVYFLGHKYRKQMDVAIGIICKYFLDENEKPISREQAAKVLKQAARRVKNVTTDNSQKLF